MNQPARKRRFLTPSLRIVLGLALGVLVGLFFGEGAGVLGIVAGGYVQLLRMTVLPYVTVSLIAGVGSLTATQARLMFTRVGAILLVIWALTLALVFLMPLTFPQWETASFFSTSLLEGHEPFDFLDLYIPANPFHSLANSIVPAVVFFSVVVGVALIGIDGKEVFLDWLLVLRRALSAVTMFVVRLAPIGLFAIAATLAGTLRPEELARVQIFLITYGAFAALLALWIVPGLVTALTPITYREILTRIHDPLVTAFLTGELFVVLPVLAEASRDLVERHAGGDAHTLTDVIVPASFNFPHAGKVLSLSFILFAGWFSETQISWTDAPKLAVTGILTFFASLNAAVPYLLDLMRIPADTYQLFLATGLVNSRVGTAVAAVHTLAIATIGAFATSGRLMLSPRRLIRFAIVTVVLTVVVTVGLRTLFDRALDRTYSKDRVLAGMHLANRSGVAATVLREPRPREGPPTQGEGGPPSSDALRRAPTKPGEVGPAPGEVGLERIRARGVLRVGYLADSLPFAFFNEAGDLVGFDVEMAHTLARELGVGLELVPTADDRMADDLASGAIDVIMSGFALTTQRAEHMAFSAPYLEEHLAFIVEDHRRGEFQRLDAVRRQPSLRVTVPNVSYYVAKLHELLPSVTVVPFKARDDLHRFFESGPGEMDALVFTAERGSAWSLLYPRFAVVVPQPQILTIPLAYAFRAGDGQMVLFLDRWLELKQRDGTIQALYDYWILGKNAQPRGPRWSIGRDVLHWWR